MKDIEVEKLLLAGVHFGHEVRRWNPKMTPYIHTVREGIHVIDLFKTKAALEAAVEVFKAASADGKTIVFVGTKRQSADVVEEEARRAGVFFLTTRWLGGLITNWDEVGKTIKRLSELKEAKDLGGERTKKERLLVERGQSRLQRLVGGLSGMEKRPELLFIVDPTRDQTAVKEARKKGIPVVAICDTNADPTLIDIPIPGNDDSMKSVRLILSILSDAILEGKILEGKKPEEKQP